MKNWHKPILGIVDFGVEDMYKRPYDFKGHFHMDRKGMLWEIAMKTNFIFCFTYINNFLMKFILTNTGKDIRINLN